MVINGTSYGDKTHIKVIQVLERARVNGWRLRIVYGDAKTGRPWAEAPEFYGATEEGYISRSCGQVKVPLAIYNRRSMGGPSILTDAIVRVEHTNKRAGGILFDIISE